MPPGQTPHTIMLFSHNDLVDAVQPGDRYVLSLIILLESRLHTLWHEIFVGSNFCDFSSDAKKEVPADKNYHKHFSCEIYSRVNIL